MELFAPATNGTFTRVTNGNFCVGIALAIVVQCGDKDTAKIEAGALEP
jgi:hypothetical protein